MKSWNHFTAGFGACLLLSAHLAIPGTAFALMPGLVRIIVYKSPTCGCCAKWEEHLRKSGFLVDSRKTENMASVKEQNGIPAALRSCHTGIVNGIVFEGHVPPKDIRNYLAARPKNSKGLAVPGMPIGSPGMEGPEPESYEVLSFDAKGQTTVFARH